VVHNGEPYGQGSNITDEQILSQITVLNEDFRRLNEDASETLPIFTPVAADTEIEFVLAKQDPEGLATTGILRVQGTRTSWNMNSDTELKSLSYWPAEDYMNIWVTTLGGGLLGYAQLPVSNLEGLEDSSNNPFTDGVVIGYNYFGSSAIYPEADLEAPWDLGRTTTHEVGHFLGLRHVWGDCGCSCDDYVEDTPTQEDSTTGCPSSHESCGSQDMFQNYMDYTDDACMNLYTEGQKQRMRIILESSPRRYTLPTSQGLEDPVSVSIDLGIKEVIEPANGICTTTLSPSVELRNYGTSTLTSAAIELWVNNSLVELKSATFTLLPLETQLVVFDEIPAPPSGSADFEFVIVEVNGGEDENPANDTLQTTVLVPEFTDLPLYEVFETFPSDWSIVNEDNEITWMLEQAPSTEGSNTAVAINFRNYTRLGEPDFLVTPQIDLSTQSNVDLLFDYSYAFTEGFSNDELRIVVSDDCGATFDMTVFSLKGAALMTTEDTDLPHIPSDRSDWKREHISLNQFAGSGFIQLAFMAINGGGNNLYLDNIQVVGQDFTDAGIKGLLSPGYVFCSENASPVLSIENSGTLPIDEVQLHYTINGGNLISESFPNLALLPGHYTEIALNPLPSGLQEYQLGFNLEASGDVISENNDFNLTIFQSCLVESIPFRENFDDIEQSSNAWTIYDKDEDGIRWTLAGSGQNALVLENFEAPNSGLLDFIYSLVIDLSGTDKASMFFDLSYALSESPGELLRVKVSTNGGLTYDDILYEKAGEDFAITTTADPWAPVSDLDWIREFIALNDYTGSTIMLTFEATGMRSNNLYIDNIEFYADDNPDPLVFENLVRVYPNPAYGAKFNMTFNLPEKEDVVIRIIDVTGREIFRSDYPGTLNQTYPFDLTGNLHGIYQIKTVGPSMNTTHRIFIHP
jgi:hypothetical protein